MVMVLDRRDDDDDDGVDGEVVGCSSIVTMVVVVVVLVTLVGDDEVDCVGGTSSADFVLGRDQKYRFVRTHALTLSGCRAAKETAGKFPMRLPSVMNCSIPSEEATWRKASAISSMEHE